MPSVYSRRGGTERELARYGRALKRSTDEFCRRAFGSGQSPGALEALPEAYTGADSEITARLSGLSQRIADFLDARDRCPECQSDKLRRDMEGVLLRCEACGTEWSLLTHRAPFTEVRTEAIPE